MKICPKSYKHYGPQEQPLSLKQRREWCRNMKDKDCAGCGFNEEVVEKKVEREQGRLW